MVVRWLRLASRSRWFLSLSAPPCGNEWKFWVVHYENRKIRHSGEIKIKILRNFDPSHFTRILHYFWLHNFGLNCRLCQLCAKKRSLTVNCVGWNAPTNLRVPLRIHENFWTIWTPRMTSRNFVVEVSKTDFVAVSPKNYVKFPSSIPPRITMQVCDTVLGIWTIMAFGIICCSL